MKQEEIREREERQRKAAGERKLKQMLMEFVVASDTVKCVSIIIHPCSVWPAR